MGIEDVNVRPDEPDDQAKGQPEPDRNPPPDRPEQSGQASGAGKRTTLESDDEATSDSGEATTESMTGLTDQKSPERPHSALVERSSYGGFDTLADEFDARAQSHENAKMLNQSAELLNSRLNGKAIQGQINPNAPDPSRSEGHKESFQRAVKENDSEWADGVDRFDDLPVGEKLAETDEDKSGLDKFRKVVLEEYGSFDKQASNVTKAIDKVLGSRPTGHAESRADGGPRVADVYHPGMDPGSTASAVLAASIFSAEVLRWVRVKIKEWD